MMQESATIVNVINTEQAVRPRLFIDHHGGQGCHGLSGNDDGVETGRR
jgi:hypothetical protein